MTTQVSGAGIKLHVYVDETVRELPGGRRLLGAGALIVTEPVGQELIDSALSALDADPDRAPSSRRFKPGHEKRDVRTLSRRYFHASDDSVNARSALATAVKARVRGKFECSFAEGSTRSDQQEFGRQSISALLPALSERLPIALIFEQRGGFSRMSAEDLIEYMNKGLDWTAYDLAMNHGIHVQIVDTKKQPVPLSQVHLDGPAPQDTTTDEHGFVTFWGLVAGDYTVSGTSRTGIPIPQTKITYPTAKTILGARVLPAQGSGGQGGAGSSAGSGSGAASSPQGAA